MDGGNIRGFICSDQHVFVIIDNSDHAADHDHSVRFCGNAFAKKAKRKV